MPLPEPMLAKPGPLPTGSGWSFEPTWDGFRAIVRSGKDYCVRSRRGWHMTELLPEFASIPIEGVFDGELVAFGADGFCPRFDDGAALWESVRDRGLKGVVAKKLSEPSRPGERSWIKRKNRTGRATPPSGTQRSGSGLDAEIASAVNDHVVERVVGHIVDLDPVQVFAVKDFEVTHTSHVGRSRASV